MSVELPSADDGVPRLYANWVTPEGGAFDLALHFGYNRPPAEQPEWLATVVLTWEEAAVLHEMLGNNIALYEEHGGTIRRWQGTPPPIDAESNGGPESEDEESDEEG